MSFGVCKEFRVINGEMCPFVEEYEGGPLIRVAWAALPGSQARFLAERNGAFICLFQGPRGGTGKSECGLIDFLQDVGIGMKSECKGYIVRRTYPQLDEPWSISKKIIPKIYPDARPNETHRSWTFPEGETLFYRQYASPDDFEDFQSKNATWVMIEELANYKTLQCMHDLTTILRSTHPLARPRMRCTTNTYGPGASEILDFFQMDRSPQPMCGPLIGEGQNSRRVITGNLAENLPLLYAQPGYAEQIRQANVGNIPRQIAHLYAIWAAPDSSFFASVNWSDVIIPPCEVQNPHRIRLGHDFGRTAPSATLFLYETKGEDLLLHDGTIKPTRKGDVVLLDEVVTQSKPGVGLNLPPSEVAKLIHAKVAERKWNPAILKKMENVADNSIFSPGQGDARASIAEDFRKAGIFFEPSSKNRLLDAAEVLNKLTAAAPPANGFREQPALFICSNCTNTIYEFQNLERDPREPDDADTDCPDHCFDALKGWLRRERIPVLDTSRRWRL